MRDNPNAMWELYMVTLKAYHENPLFKDTPPEDIAKDALDAAETALDVWEERYVKHEG